MTENHDRRRRDDNYDSTYGAGDISLALPKVGFPDAERDPRRVYAAMLGGLAMKRRWEARRRAEGKSTDKPNLVTGPVQICWHKLTRYWDIVHREIPMEDGRLLMSPEEVLSRCDENTIGVVPTLGVTFTGEYELVKAVSDALDDLQVRTGLDIPIHVDGASGGFLAPFCERGLEWDFRLPRVRSINASGHKFDLADRLRVRGWQVPAYTLPANCQNQAVQRILVRNGVSHDLCSLLMDHMKSALAHFQAHPVQKSLTKHEASGFHH